MLNNIILRLSRLTKNISWDSTSKGKSTLIFSCPVVFNTQEFGETTGASTLPDGTVAAERPKLIFIYFLKHHPIHCIILI